jgi:hypothetical protein
MATEPAAPAQEKLPFPLQDGERVLVLCRRHWVYLWPNIGVMLLIALVPAVAIALILSAADAYKGVVANIYWLAALVWFAIWGVRIFLTWYRYHNDIWVISSQRIIDSFKRNPFSLRVASADLVNVQDMTVERHGLLQTFLDYGDIVCQTAAEQQDFRLAGIPDPRTIQALVDRERDRERARVHGTEL